MSAPSWALEELYGGLRGPLRRVQVSAKAFEIVYGPSARQALESGAIPGSVEFAPGWWQWDAPREEEVPSAIPPKIENPTIRVFTGDGALIWEQTGEDQA